ncbi:hypothetical protein [Alkalibacterium pelagium]|uniref:hypothetical protein n=1 Tax=Alkalibacterium pelagium TaxID=426702 RepID=UPI000B8485C0|nr:hypothetical protein [Alkalibacterium pelagium]GEN50186.1 hypothetical protein APE02nite_08510 [Alkalibacterium pelagium]
MKKEQSTVAVAFSFILFLLLYNFAYEFAFNQTLVNLRLVYIAAFGLFYLYVFYVRRKRINRK